MEQGKLEGLYNLAVEKGYTEKADYLKSLMEEANVEQQNRKFNTRKRTAGTSWRKQKHTWTAKNGGTITVSSSYSSKQTIS